MIRDGFGLVGSTNGWWRPELGRRQPGEATAAPLLPPSCSCPEPAWDGLVPAVVEHRHHADLRQRGEQEETGLAGARVHPPSLVLLRRLPGWQPRLASLHSSSSHRPDYCRPNKQPNHFQPLGLTSVPGHGNNNDYNDESLYEIVNLQDDPQVRVRRRTNTNT